MQLEALGLVHPAEGAFVMGTAGRYLQEDGVRFAGGPEYVSLIVHDSIIN